MNKKIINTSPNLVQSGIDRRKLGQERADFMNQSLQNTGTLNRFNPAAQLTATPIIDSSKIRENFSTLAEEKKKKEETKKNTLLPYSTEAVEMNRPEIGKISNQPSMLTGMQIGKADYSNTRFITKQEKILKETAQGMVEGAEKAASGVVGTILEYASLLGEDSLKDKAAKGLSLMLGIPHFDKGPTSSKLEAAAGGLKTVASPITGVFNTGLNVASSLLSGTTGIDKEKIDSTVSNAVGKIMSPIAPILEYGMNYVEGLPEQDKKDIANLGSALASATEIMGFELTPKIGKKVISTAASTYKQAMETSTAKALKQAVNEATDSLKKNDWFNNIKDKIDTEKAVEFVNKLPLKTTAGIGVTAGYLGQLNEEGDFMDRVKAAFVYTTLGAGAFVGARSVNDILKKAMPKSAPKTKTKSPSGLWGSVNDVLKIFGQKEFGFNDVAARIEGTLENNIVKGISIAKDSGVDFSTAVKGSRQLTNFAQVMRNTVNKNIKKIDNEYSAMASSKGSNYEALGISAIDDKMDIQEKVSKMFGVANEEQITEFAGHTLKNIKEKGIEILDGPAKEQYANFTAAYRDILSSMVGMAFESKGLGIPKSKVELYNKLVKEGDLFEIQRIIKQEVYSMKLDELKSFKESLSAYQSYLTYAEGAVVTDKHRSIFNTIYGEVREVMATAAPKIANEDRQLSYVLDAIKHMQIKRIIKVKGKEFFTSKEGAVNNWKAYSLDQLLSVGVSPELFFKAATKSISSLISSFKLRTQNAYNRIKNKGQYVFGEKTDLTGESTYDIKPMYEYQTEIGTNEKSIMLNRKLENMAREEAEGSMSPAGNMFAGSTEQQKKSPEIKSTSAKPSAKYKKGAEGKKPMPTIQALKKAEPIKKVPRKTIKEIKNTKSGVKTSDGKEIKTKKSSGIKPASGIDKKNNTIEGKIITKAKTENKEKPFDKNSFVDTLDYANKNDEIININNTIKNDLITNTKDTYNFDEKYYNDNLDFRVKNFLSDYKDRIINNEFKDGKELRNAISNDIKWKEKPPYYDGNLATLEFGLKSILPKNKKSKNVGAQGTKEDTNTAWNNIIDIIKKQKPKEVKETEAILQNTLHEEARKYKTKEEFVRAQGTPVYHGTQAKFDKFDSKFATDAEGRKLNLGWGKGNFYFTTKKGEALKYATRERSPEVAKLYPKGEPNVVEAFVDIKKPFDMDSAKNAERWRKVRDGYWSDGVSDFNYHKISKGKTKAEAFVEQLKKEGYDGIIDGQEITAFSESSIKTKSQLEQIWEEANKKEDQIVNFDNKTAMSKTSPLHEEARKYKTKEEFVNENILDDGKEVKAKKSPVIKPASGIGKKNNTMEGTIITKAKTEKEFLTESEAGEGMYTLEIDKKIDGYGTPSVVNNGKSFLYTVSKEKAKEIWKKLSRNQN